MRTFFASAMLVFAAGSAIAQTTTCLGAVAGFTNCTTTGPQGVQTSNCMTGPAGMTTCTTTGPAATASGGGTDVAAYALGELFGALRKASKAHQDRVEEDRIQRVAVLITRHDCTGAVALANQEHDAWLAGQVPQLCKTAAQSGEEPPYLLASAPENIVPVWVRTFLHFPQGIILLSASREMLEVQVPSVGAQDGTWVRTEAMNPTGQKLVGGRSSLMLVSIDCKAGQYVIKASTVFAGQNLTGESHADDHVSPPAFYRPGSSAEIWARHICAGPATAIPQPLAGTQAASAPRTP